MRVLHYVWLEGLKTLDEMVYGDGGPFPNCRARIIPLREGDVKICPICRFRWTESGGFALKQAIW